jgi:hypothetical protein
VATQVAAFLDAPPGEVHSQCAAAREWIDENLDLSAAIGKLADYYETSFAALSGGTEV